jgi:hypothetical protein
MSHPIVSTLAARVALLATAMALLLTATPVHGASSVEIDARPLLGGRYQVGGWAAISVSLVNEGEPTEGYLTAETRAGVMRRFVEMPAGARKSVTLYVQPEAFQRRITVRYEEPNGVKEVVVEVRVFEQSGGQIAVVGDGAGTLRPQLLAVGADGRPEPIGLSVADIPERPEPLAGLSGMVWAADSTGLTDAQRRSLERWVTDGGQLVVLGGGDWQARTDRLATLLPLDSLGGRDGVPQAALAAWAGVESPAVDAATTLTGSPVPGARVLARAEDGTPLLSLRAVGAGRVVLVGSDLATDAHRGWAGASGLWSRLLVSTTALEQFWGGGVPLKEEADNALSQALGNLPALAVPPAELLLAVIVGYILLIGPVSYVVLRRLDRRELAWITAPVLVVLFTACSYGIGTTMKGSDVIVNQISLIRSSEGGSAAMVQAYAGIFSPERATFDLTVEADALMGRLRPTNVAPNQPPGGVVADQGDPAHLRGLAIGVFGFEGVRADAIVAHRPALAVSWVDGRGDIVGRVTNVSDEPISDVAFIGVSTGVRIGDLGPGQSAEFTVPRRNLNGSSASDQVYGFAGFGGRGEEQRTMLVRRQVIDALVGYGGWFPGLEVSGMSGRGPFVIGWRTTPGPLEVSVDGGEPQRLGHTVEVIAVRPLTDTGDVTIGAARMSVIVRDLEGDASAAGMGGLVAMTEGAATFDIALPLEASGMAADQVDIIIGSDLSMVLDPRDFGGGGFWADGFSAELRNPATGEWTPLGDLSQRTRFTIDDPAAAISPAGRIEVRVRAEGANPNFGPTTVVVSAEVSGVIGE